MKVSILSMYERLYHVLFDENDNTIAEKRVAVEYDVYDSTVLNLKAIAQSVQSLLFDALDKHDFEFVRIAERALESIESVNYRVFRDMTSSIDMTVIVIYLN